MSEFFDGRDYFFIRSYIFVSLGVFISAAAALWSEDIAGYAKQYAITAAVIILWGVYCFFMPAHGVTLIAESVAIGSAAFLSI
ncbi:hypothetical protein [Treponema sp. R8-4-B8]